MGELACSAAKCCLLAGLAGGYRPARTARALRWRKLRADRGGMSSAVDFGSQIELGKSLRYELAQLI